MERGSHFQARIKTLQWNHYFARRIYGNRRSDVLEITSCHGGLANQATGSTAGYFRFSVVHPDTTNDFPVFTLVHTEWFKKLVPSTWWYRVTRRLVIFMLRNWYHGRPSFTKCVWPLQNMNHCPTDYIFYLRKMKNSLRKSQGIRSRTQNVWQRTVSSPTVLSVARVTNLPLHLDISRSFVRLFL